MYHFQERTSRSANNNNQRHLNISQGRVSSSRRRRFNPRDDQGEDNGAEENVGGGGGHVINNNDGKSQIDDRVNLKSSRTNGLGLFRLDGPRAPRQNIAAKKAKPQPQYTATDEAGQAVLEFASEDERGHRCVVGQKQSSREDAGSSLWSSTRSLRCCPWSPSPPRRSRWCG